MNFRSDIISWNQNSIAYLKRNSKFISQCTHPCQTSLIVWTTPSYINMHSWCFELGFLWCRKKKLIELPYQPEWNQQNESLIYKCGITFSLRALIIPLNVAATSVKLAIPPPIRRALLRPSGVAVAHYNIGELNCQLANMWHDSCNGCNSSRASYINHNSRILQHLFFIWSSTVLCIVSKFWCITQISNLLRYKTRILG